MIGIVLSYAKKMEPLVGNEVVELSDDRETLRNMRESARLLNKMLDSSSSKLD